MLLLSLDKKWVIASHYDANINEVWCARLGRSLNEWELQ